MKSIHASCWHWSFISKMGTHMAGMAQVVDRHLGGHYSSSHLDSRVWGAPLLKSKSSMEWLRFESYTATIYHGCSSYPTLLVGGPEPGWEGNTDKVMYWHGPRMLRYTYYLLACVWKVYLQWGTSPICGVRKWPLYLYIKMRQSAESGQKSTGSISCI